MKNKLRASQGMVDYFKKEQESILKESSQKTNVIDDWLDKNGNPEIAKQVEEEAKELCKQETLEKLPTNLESVLAKITHINDLGLSQWYEVVYYDNDKWCSYSGSKTFQDGERVIGWKYCKDLI